MRKILISAAAVVLGLFATSAGAAKVTSNARTYVTEYAPTVKAADPYTPVPVNVKLVIEQGNRRIENHGRAVFITAPDMLRSGTYSVGAWSEIPYISKLFKGTDGTLNREWSTVKDGYSFTASPYSLTDKSLTVRLEMNSTTILAEKTFTAPEWPEQASSPIIANRTVSAVAVLGEPGQTVEVDMSTFSSGASYGPGAAVGNDDKGIKVTVYLTREAR